MLKEGCHMRLLIELRFFKELGAIDYTDYRHHSLFHVLSFPCFAQTGVVHFPPSMDVYIGLTMIKQAEKTAGLREKDIYVYIYISISISIYLSLSLYIYIHTCKTFSVGLPFLPQEVFPKLFSK